MRIRITALVLCIAVAPLALAACGESTSDKIAEQVVEQQTGDDVDIDSEKGEVNVTSKDGSSSFSSSGDLPKGWPKDVELPDGAKIKGSSAVKADGGTNLMVSAEDKGASLDDIVEHFDEQLDGWKNDSVTSSDTGKRASAFQSWTKDGQVFTLVVSDAGDTRTFVATITPDSGG
jgi:hypothetical protein